MIEFHIVRHGETDYNKEGKYLGRMDVLLNLAGIAQAEELVENSDNLDIDVIYCSSLKRAVQTAEFIKLKHDCEVIIDDHFIERSVGVYEGLTKEEAKRNYPEMYEKNITRIFNEAPLNGETINEVTKRVFFGLNEIKKQNKYSNIMIVTHGFVVKIINKYFNPEISEQEFFDFSLNNAEVKRYILKNNESPRKFCQRVIH